MFILEACANILLEILLEFVFPLVVWIVVWPIVLAVCTPFLVMSALFDQRKFLPALSDGYRSVSAFWKNFFF